jgi:hypothetical protein
MINAFSAASVRESRLSDFVGFYWPDRCSCRRGGFRVREEDKGKIWRRPSPLRGCRLGYEQLFVRRGQTCHLCVVPLPSVDRCGLVSVSVKILFETHTTQLVRALDQTSLKFHRATWIAGH